MKRKRLDVQVVLAVVCVAGVLGLGLWLLGSPRSSTADVLFPFYSPITPIGDPQLALSKTVDNENPKVGDEITYSLSYANVVEGSQAFNVRLYEFLPAGFEFLSSDPVADAVQGGIVYFSAPSIGPDTESVEVSVRGRVLDGYEHLYNHALVMADGTMPAHAALWTEVAQMPVWLDLTKTGYTVALIDDQVVYSLVCENTGTETAEQVALVDVLPSELSLVSAAPPPDDVMSPVLRWSLGDLPPGEQRTVVITATTPNTVGVVSNTALADSRQHVVTQTVFSTQIVDQAAILRVTKKGSAPVVHPGGELVYTLEYENGGNLAATGVRLTDTLPADISVNGVYPPALSLTNEQGVWAIGELGAGVTGQIVITTTVEGRFERTLLNTVDITGQPGSFPGHAELETDVRLFWLYLPFMLQRYSQ
jgi:uncharacterized repeat protein (TIGR01451 family)